MYVQSSILGFRFRGFQAVPDTSLVKFEQVFAVRAPTLWIPLLKELSEILFQIICFHPLVLS